MPLWAVDGDPNSHGAGGLVASGSVYINNTLVTHIGTDSAPDILCPIVGGAHCSPVAAAGSDDVYVYGIASHRNGDARSCGAGTVVEGQDTVFVN